MQNFLITLVINAIAVYAAAWFLDGVRIDGYLSAIITALLLGFANGYIRPVLRFISFPITLVTLGLFLLVINAAIVLLVDFFVDGFWVEGWLTAVIFSVILWLLNWLLSSVISASKKIGN